MPELAGAVGIAGVVALVVVAGGSGSRLAGGLWLVLAARSVAAIPTVRDQVGRLHGRPGAPRTLVVADVAATAVATAAALLSPAVRVGALAVLGLVAAQRLLERRPTDRAVVIGLRQTVLGLALVAVTALGVAFAWRRVRAGGGLGGRRNRPRPRWDPVRPKPATRLRRLMPFSMRRSITKAPGSVTMLHSTADHRRLARRPGSG